MRKFNLARLALWQMNRHVAWDVIAVRGRRHYLVSTIRLPIDHGWNGIPLWFETMVFTCDKDGNLPSIEAGGGRDHFQARYTTQEEAQTGHDWLVQAILDWGEKWDVIEDQWRNRPTGQDLTA